MTAPNIAGTIRAPRRHTGVDIANALSSFIAGRRGETERLEDKSREQALQDAMRDLQERQLGLSSRGVQLQEQESRERSAERTRVLTEQQREKGDIISRIMQLEPKMTPAQLDDLSNEALRMQWQILESRNAEIAATKAKLALDKTDRLISLRRMQEAASDELNKLDEMIKQGTETFYMNPAAAAEWRQRRQTYKPGDPDPREAAMIKHIFRGRDVFAERDAIARRHSEIGMQIYGETGERPTLDRATAEKLGFKNLPPDQQQAILSEMEQRMNNGQPLPIRSLQAQGVPIEEFAQSRGFILNPETGVVSRPVQMPPVGQSLGKIQDLSMAAVTAPRPQQAPSAPSVAPSAAPSTTVTGAQAPAVPSVNLANPAGPMAARTLPPTLARSAPASSGFTQSPSVANPAGPMTARSLPSGTFTPQSQLLNPLQQMLQERTGPSVRSANFPVGSLGNQPTIGPQTVPSQPTGNIPTVESGTSVFDAASQSAAQGMANAASAITLASLRYQPNLASAEALARQLLSSGTPYEAVVQNLPDQFKPLLSAKLPKRISGQ